MVRIFLHEPGHIRRQKVVAGRAERVGKPGIRVNGHVAIRQSGQFFRKGAHQVRPQGAINAYGEGAHVADGVPECFNGLAGQRASGFVRQRDGHHDRNRAFRLFLKNFFNGEQGSLGVQRVENRLHQQHVHSPFHSAVLALVHSPFQQSQRLIPVRLPELAEIHGAEAGIIHIGRQGTGDGHGTDGAGHQTGFAVCGFRFVARLPGERGSRQVQFPDKGFQFRGVHHLLEILLVLVSAFFRTAPEIIMLADVGGSECAGFQNIRPSRVQKAAVNIQNNIRPGQNQKVVIIL